MGLKRTRRKQGSRIEEIYTLDVPAADLKEVLENIYQHLSDRRAQRPPDPANGSHGATKDRTATTPAREGVVTYTYDHKCVRSLVRTIQDPLPGVPHPSGSGSGTEVAGETGLRAGCGACETTPNGTPAAPGRSAVGGAGRASSAGRRRSRAGAETGSSPTGTATMRCYCCAAAMALARKVKLRPYRDDVPQGGPNSAAYRSFVEDLTFRWAVICQACYGRLDNEIGVGAIGDRLFNLAGASRGDKAAVLNEAKYQAFQRRQAAQLGIDLCGASSGTGVSQDQGGAP